MSASAGWRELQRTEPPPPVVSPAAAIEPVAAADPAAGSAGERTAGNSARPTSRPLAELSRDDLAIHAVGPDGGAVPDEEYMPEETFEPRRFATTTFTWKAAGYCHKPLYFEHWNLERYGHSHGFAADTFLSAVHFFARIPALPYQMGVELPWECVYPLGYYRPGSCAPWTVPAVPVSCRGLALEAAAATGIVFLLP